MIKGHVSQANCCIMTCALAHGACTLHKQALQSFTILYFTIFAINCLFFIRFTCHQKQQIKCLHVYCSQLGFIVMCWYIISLPNEIVKLMEIEKLEFSDHIDAISHLSNFRSC